MRFVELFAGAGGLSLGLERAGMTCVGHAEIEPHARAVLRHHWPDVPLWGDVAQLTGRDFPACDLLSGGSPCQDLSVAGKRAGIVDGARSSLFFTQARLWTECGAPYLLWENVAGALSSNAGRDFALVLSTLVGAPIPVPRDGWAGGGVAAGPDAVAAWRVCDLRYFGVRGFGPPQRRVRVFVLAARAGAADPAEILALSQGVCGHPDPREAAGEGAAAEVGASVAGSLGSHHSGGRRDDLDSNGCYPVQRVSVGESEDVSPTITRRVDGGWSGGGQGMPPVVQSYGWDQRNVTSPDNRTSVTPGMVGTLHAGGMECVQPLAFHATQEPISGAESPALGANSSIGVLTRGGFGDWREQSAVSALCSRDHKDQSSIVVAPTLSPGAHTGAPGSNGQDAEQFAALTLAYQERPRRLMPLECERLMGWPDDHTARGVDENGKSYALKDTPRYRLCGNGVGSPVAEWIGRRLMGAAQTNSAPSRGAA